MSLHPTASEVWFAINHDSNIIHDYNNVVNRNKTCNTVLILILVHFFTTTLCDIPAFAE